ncbi:MAG: hypothetical protein Q4A00_05540 [Flavobacteriaceae bacterium]|nr:hypothetical protein [Flavobacteriaceae bacterium]
MWYNLNINKLVELLLPTFLRKEKMLAWLRVLHFPLIKVVDDFNFNRNQNLYNLAHNGQVCYLRKALNDKFDVSDRRIRIADGNRFQRQYIYTRAEQKPLYLGTIYLYNRADYGDTGVDFIVLIPKGLKYNEFEMKALIDFYKLASKRYKIECY